MSTATQQTAPGIEVDGGTLTLTDEDGDRLEVYAGKHRLLVRASQDGDLVTLDRAQALALHQHLAYWITSTRPDTEDSDTEDARDYAWPPLQQAPHHDTILDEARDACYGERHDDYGHPRQDFTRTAILWQGLLHHKLADGESMTPEDVARCMIAVKLARDVHAPKRDNRVDMAGYALCLDRLETGQ